MSYIEIIINPQGQSQVQTTGFNGATCRIASQFLEQAMGKVCHEEFTAEFHQVPVSQQATGSERA